MRISNEQLAQVNHQIKALESAGSFYGKKLAEAGIHSVSSPEEFERLPFSEKSDLRDAYPLGLMTAPEKDIVRIHSSSGTTGLPVIIPYTAKDVEDWAIMFLALLICVAAFISNQAFFLLGLLALNLALGALGRVFPQMLRILKGLGKACVFMFILQVLFIQQGNPYFSFVGIQITDFGVRTAYMVILRLLDATLPLSLMLTVTRLTDLSNALVVHWRLPYQYAFTITTALHFIPVFFNDMQAISEAQLARGVSFDEADPAGQPGPAQDHGHRKPGYAALRRQGERGRHRNPAPPHRRPRFPAGPVLLCRGQGGGSARHGLADYRSVRRRKDDLPRSGTLIPFALE